MGRFTGEASDLNKPDGPMALELASTAFAHNEDIPAKYTCDGENISPPLTWSGVPIGTEALALIVDDPDAPDPENPQRTFVHWVLYNISPELEGLSEGTNEGNLPTGARSGVNDWGNADYGGPCPPTGRHRYFFKLYALDSALLDFNEPTKEELLETIEEHILEAAELVGTYKRS